ncbi:MAG: cytochrome c3 family protein [Desulfobulbaceae bacterium]|nr:cytochrome c3 family protein [Desulfobulbaceae bacterium]
MKKTLLVGLAIGVVSLAASSAFAKSSDGGLVTGTGTGGTGIVGTKHDLGATGDAQSRICVFCHHPHNALKANQGSGVTAVGAYSPLWNRNMSTLTFTAYNNGNMMGNASTSQHTLNAGSNALSGVSLLCMSCHDGVVALDAYSQHSGSTLNKGANTANGNITGSAAFGGGTGDMSNHHPMGFVYATVQSADNEIASPNTIMVPNTTVTIGSLLNGGKMECVTCHDVHNTANQANAERFLWRTNNKSNFCLTCHLK